jgi:hypothetical protein
MVSNKTVALIPFVLSLLLYSFTTFAQPQLKVSENGRYLVTSDGKPFFYLGDTAWELIHRSTREEAEKYLENRRQKGFTVIQAVALAEMDGLGTPNAYGDLPLIDKNPVKYALTPGNDPANAQQYDYWDHVDYIVDAAARKGMYIGLLPSWGEWILPRFGPQYFSDEKQAYTYGHFIGDRYKDRKNIIWILGGDRHPDEKPDGFVIWQAMAEGIADGTNGVNKRDEQADYTTTLMTYHSFPSSSNFFHTDPWIDFHMWGSYHGEYDNPRAYKAAAVDWNLQNHKPTLNSEPAYEDHPVDYNQEAKFGYFDEKDVRQAAYWSVFAGALGHTYGAHPIWQFLKEEVRKKDTYTRHYWYEVTDLPGAFQMTHLRNLMESRPFLSRVPDQSLLAQEADTGIHHQQASRGEDYAFIYLPTGKPVQVQLGKIAGQNVQAWWFNPRNGEAKSIGRFKNQGTRSFDPPGEAIKGNDWVLVMDNAEKKFGKPGAR